MNETERKKKLTVPTGRIRLVIDSDAKNEIDDQFAISWALRSPERFDVEAVYAAPFSHTAFQHNLGNWDYPVVELPDVGMEQSYQEILKLYDLLGLDSTGKVFRGADHYLPSPVLQGDCTWGAPQADRHLIRVANYCQRDLIFGDLVACLDHD